MHAWPHVRIYCKICWILRIFVEVAVCVKSLWSIYSLNLFLLNNYWPNALICCDSKTVETDKTDFWEIVRRSKSFSINHILGWIWFSNLRDTHQVIDPQRKMPIISDDTIFNFFDLTKIFAARDSCSRIINTVINIDKNKTRFSGNISYV